MTVIRNPLHCYKCKYCFHKRHEGHGGIQYGCTLMLGIVTGSISIAEKHEPISCEKFEYGVDDQTPQNLIYRFKHLSESPIG